MLYKHCINVCVCFCTGQSVPEEDDEDDDEEEEDEEDEDEEEYTDSKLSDTEDPEAVHSLANPRLQVSSAPMAAQQPPPHMQAPPITGPPPLGPPPAPPMRPPSGPPPGPPPGALLHAFEWKMSMVVVDWSTAGLSS